jgi:lipopolysaccharide assembly protein A
MKIFGWVIKLVFFLLVLWFALKNTTPVPVRFTAEATWEQVPLIVVMLACVALGALLGALALAMPMYRLRREVGSQRRPAVERPPTLDTAGERITSAARQSGAVAELGAVERR